MIPIELAQAWAIERAGQDDFEKFEAYGTATAAMWFLRVFFVVATNILGIFWLRRAKVLPVIAGAIDDFWRMTDVARDSKPVKSSLRIRLVQGFVMTWFVLGLYQFSIGIHRRLKEWPVYRLNPGSHTLPNISDSNRDVIRYLTAATEPNARILVLSDQKLYFLSYYLLPRRLYHPTHPDSEFVIAKPHNERQMASYRLQDLTADQIQHSRPDYILEYFEGKIFTENENLSRDVAWLSFQRHRFGPTWQPSYLVSLRKYSAGDTP